MLPNLDSTRTLKTAIYWAKFSAILTFIGLGLEFFQMLFGAISLSKSVLGIGLKFIITSIFSLVTAINLYNFAKYAKVSLDSHDEKFLFQAFRHLRIFFTVLGISIIILSTLFILGISIFIISKFINS